MWSFPLVARVDPKAGVDAVGNGGATPFKTIAFAMKRGGRPITALARGTYSSPGNVNVSVQGPIASVGGGGSYVYIMSLNGPRAIAQKCFSNTCIAA